MVRSNESHETYYESAPRWCKVVQRKQREVMPIKTKSEPTARTSVTFPVEVYASLGIIAKQKKVSTAWVIREAAERYVADQWPLFAPGIKNG
jgi:hypothetical protein